MDFRQLEIFCAIVEWGNFSEAARHLFITQPTVSSSISKLESQLGTKLIERTTKVLILTDDGRRLYEYAKSILKLRDKALGAFDKTTESNINLGVSSIPGSYILPAMLTEFKSDHPEVKFSLYQSDSGDIINNLHSGSLDLAITGSPVTDDSFVCESIFKDEMVLATPANSYFKLLQSKKTPIPKLLTEPYLMRESGSGTKREAEAYLESINMDSSSLNVVAEMNSLEAILRSVSEGLGISILSTRVTESMAKTGEILTFSLGEYKVYRYYYLIYRKSVSFGKMAMDFIEFLLEKGKIQ